MGFAFPSLKVLNVAVSFVRRLCMSFPCRDASSLEMDGPEEIVLLQEVSLPPRLTGEVEGPEEVTECRVAQDPNLST